VKKAIQSVKFQAENFVIKTTGRTSNENAFILILNGIYKGFGFANKKEKLISINDYLGIIEPKKYNNDIKRILNSYLKNKENTVEILNDYIPELNLVN
jgi:DNA polymerase-3 subunit epsilon